MHHCKLHRFSIFFPGDTPGPKTGREYISPVLSRRSFTVPLIQSFAGRCTGNIIDGIFGKQHQGKQSNKAGANKPMTDNTLWPCSSLVNLDYPAARIAHSCGSLR